MLLNWWLRVKGFKKKCKCKDEWRAIRAKTDDRIYYICTKCLRGWHVSKTASIKKDNPL